jgi:hypothetical protein
MNCDDVFAILTRGPFPTGSRIDGAVESHLRTCADCQRLAEALRPNSGLIQESIGIDESRVLPGYWGGSLPLSGDIAVSVDERSIQARRFPRASRMPVRLVRSESLRLWQFAAAVALGIVLDGAFRTLISVHATEVPNATSRDPMSHLMPPSSTMTVTGSIENDEGSINDMNQFTSASGMTTAPAPGENNSSTCLPLRMADRPIPVPDAIGNQAGPEVHLRARQSPTP